MLWSVYNLDTKAWATATNYSTKAEAETLLRIIKARCWDHYEVRSRAFGTIKE